MARPAARVLTLLELLQSGGVRTVAELADRLGVEGRTVRRYVDHLIDLDVPVESVRGRYGGYGLVAHAGRWYVTGADPGIGEDRTFRLDRIADARTLPGSFEPPAGLDPAQRVLSGLATAPYRYQVTLRIQATAEQIRARLPAS